MLRRLASIGVMALAFASVSACDSVVVSVDPRIECGAYEGPDCNDLLEIGLDAVAGGRPDEPLAIAVDRACPPNARCVMSVLGGDTAAVVVRWNDGTLGWASIPLPPDWPASPAGSATVMSDAPPAHILPLVGVEPPLGIPLPT
jgi:hypothetical protein